MRGRLKGNRKSKTGRWIKKVQERSAKRERKEKRKELKKEKKAMFPHGNKPEPVKKFFDDIPQELKI